MQRTCRIETWSFRSEYFTVCKDHAHSSEEMEQDHAQNLYRQLSQHGFETALHWLYNLDFLLKS